jgi:vanillate O-demethylase monooxygenase subunit
MALWAGGVVSGQPREQGTQVTQAHIFTPRDAVSTHYFYSISFPRAMGPLGEQLARDQVRVLDQVFSDQDKPMLEAQARNMGGADFWSLNPVLLRVDTAAVTARRLLARLIAAESVEREGHIV